MDQAALAALLGDVRGGRISIDDALERLRALPFAELGVARVDHHRALRCGAPEVIFAEGKSCEDLVRIAEELLASGAPLLATRVSAEQAAALAELDARIAYHPRPRIAALGGLAKRDERIALLCAGTSDIAVAEESRLTAEWMGLTVDTAYDVGVAGLHRLVDVLPSLRAARVVVVVAGMEGALPSVVAGMIDRPVIAVPTSVGYGAAFGGLAALLGMLNSCGSGVVVVNIDNGFGAGYAAALMCREPQQGGA